MHGIAETRSGLPHTEQAQNLCLMVHHPVPFPCVYQRASSSKVVLLRGDAPRLWFLLVFAVCLGEASTASKTKRR